GLHDHARSALTSELRACHCRGERSRTQKTDTFNKAKALFDAAYRGDAGAADALLIAGAPLDARDRRGNTPLMVAAANGHDEGVELLIDWGAQGDSADLPGLTALMAASIGGPADAARILLEHNARVNAATVDGMTALM